MKTFSTHEKAGIAFIAALILIILFISLSQGEYKEDQFLDMPDTTKLKVVQALEADDIPATPENIIWEYNRHIDLYK